jgi:23S rRNA (adenine2503-C2)-methyltransferase
MVADAQRPQWPGLRVDALAQMLGSRTRAHAALRWLYGCASPPPVLPAALSGVKREFWTRFLAACDWTWPKTLARHAARDGTVKYALGFGPRVEVETVLIPGQGRSTVCISSQAGCTRDCGFCATAQLRFVRNLTASEMVAQFLRARGEANAGAPARNVVFMGMGEPMDNLDEVLDAVEVLTQLPAPGLAAGHITVSTSGVLPGMRRFLRECRAHLALSLNGTTDEQREQLMPQTRTWPIRSLLKALREHAAFQPGRRSFIEYVLFEGVNDSEEDATRLIALLEGIPARVNLIPHNPTPLVALRPPSRARVLAFQDIVHRGGVRALVRWPRGQDIAAACGQLALASPSPAEAC